MVVRRELLRGLDRLHATTTVLQRARRADPLAGMWEAADVQWWWRRPRATDELALPVWFDDVGPVAAAGLTAWDTRLQADVFAVPSIVNEEEVWAATLDATAAYPGEPLELLVHDDDAQLADLAIQSGFAMTDALSGTTWMDANDRPPVSHVDGFTIVDRVVRADRPHPMIARNGELVEHRLRQCSLYDPALDLAVEDADGRVAGYALFWFDPTTLVGLLEPMRVEDDYQRRGLARMLLTHGLDGLARTGARRLKVGFATDAARHLYVGAGFVQTSVDRQLVRPAAHQRIVAPGAMSPDPASRLTGMETERVNASTTIEAAPEAVFAVLADPSAHAEIDGTGWVRGSLDGDRITGAGQVFRMAMYHPNHPDKNYRIANLVEVFDEPRAIAWKPGTESAETGELSFGGWTWRYDLEATGPSRTRVTLTYDWSAVPPEVREYIAFPPFGPDHLDNSLQHLADLVA